MLKLSIILYNMQLQKQLFYYKRKFKNLIPSLSWLKYFGGNILKIFTTRKINIVWSATVRSTPMVNTQYPLPPQPLHIYDIKLLDNRYNTDIGRSTIYFQHSRLTSKRVLFIVNSTNSWCKDLVKALYCVFTVPWGNQAKNYLIIGSWCALLSIWEELHLGTRNEDPISLPKK